MIYDIRDLTFSYPGSGRRVLDGASLRLEEGRILAILGANGAGKTTLLNCMAGLLKPDGGTIELCGRKLGDMKEKEIARLVGYVPQIHTPAFDYRVLDFVLMGRAPGMGTFSRPTAEDERVCREVLESMDIGHLAEKSYRNISGGERQQALIARAIVQKPKAILFDEPTAHLDFGNQQRVLTRIRRMAGEGYSVVITTHNPDHALLLGDQAAIVDRQGGIVQGDRNEIITEERLRGIYGVELKLREVDELGRKVCLMPDLEPEQAKAQEPERARRGQA